MSSCRELAVLSSFGSDRAVVDQGVRGIVYLSSLRMMSGYDKSFQIGEGWRPLPTSASGGLSDYLGEFVCREFAREGMDAIVNLSVVRRETGVRKIG
jgi:hypothetical protein